MSKYLTTKLEIKNLSDREFEGHGSVFGNEDLGGDVVMPGAFKNTLKMHQKEGSLPQMFWMHDPARVAGKWTHMEEDERGLKVRGVLADTPLGNEIRELLKMDAVKGLSIGYRTVKDEWDKQNRRLLKELELWEVSVVSLPMNPLAQVAHAKSRLSEYGEYVPTSREFEHALRDVGCSQKTAKSIISKIYDDEDTRDEPVIEEADEARDVLDALKKVEEEAIARQLHKLVDKLKR